MTDFQAELRKAFAQEAETLMGDFRQAMTRYSQATSAGERHQAIGSIRRLAHTLKGAGRSVELPEVESLSMSLEDRCRQLERTADPYLDEDSFAVLQTAERLLGGLVKDAFDNGSPVSASELQKLLLELEDLEASSPPEKSLEAVFVNPEFTPAKKEKWITLVGMLEKGLPGLKSNPKTHAGRGFKIVYALSGLARDLKQPPLSRLLSACETLFRQSAEGGGEVPVDGVKNALDLLKAVVETPGPAAADFEEALQKLETGPVKKKDLEDVLQEAFREETTQNARILKDGFEKLARPTPEIVTSLFLATHSLKGAARAVDLPSVKRSVTRWRINSGTSAAKPNSCTGSFNRSNSLATSC